MRTHRVASVALTAVVGLGTLVGTASQASAAPSPSNGSVIVQSGHQGPTLGPKDVTQPTTPTTVKPQGPGDIAIPPHVVPVIKRHLTDMPMAGRDALLFPSAHDPTRHMRPATLYRVYYPARNIAGRPDLRFHDLRHTGAVYATMKGASLAEVMARLGHSTPSAAMRYQHAAQGRDAEIANELSKLATGQR